MQYDPIKKSLGSIFNRSPFSRKLFYRLLDILLLRAWYIRRELRRFRKVKGQDADILDAGAGFGQYCYYMSTLSGTWRITAVELKNEQVEDCNRFFSMIHKPQRVFFEEANLLTYRMDIQSNPGRLLARGAQAVENQTGGSTGQPLRFYQDAEYLEWKTVSLSWGFSLCGFKGGEKQAVLWGSDYDTKWHEKLKGHLWDCTHNIRFINAFDITDRQLKQVAQELSRWQPDYIWGYASTLDLLADQVVRDRLQLCPKGVQSTAGTLYPSLRDKLERVFGKVVYDRYGCREVGIIAHECSEHEGLHVFSFHNYFELIGGDDFEFGRIVVTNLHNKAFPFIRYDIGDLALWANRECGCGRSFPLVGRVIGRTVEIITSPSGKLIDGEFFTHLFYGRDDILQFQVHQKSLNRVEVRYVPAGRRAQASMTEIRQKIHDRLGEEVHVAIVACESMHVGPSGKHRFTISDVKERDL